MNTDRLQGQGKSSQSEPVLLLFFPASQPQLTSAFLTSCLLFSLVHKGGQEVPGGPGVLIQACHLAAQ